GSHPHPASDAHTPRGTPLPTARPPTPAPRPPRPRGPYKPHPPSPPQRATSAYVPICACSVVATGVVLARRSVLPLISDRMFMSPAEVKAHHARIFKYL